MIYIITYLWISGLQMFFLDISMIINYFRDEEKEE